jgi:hypothetical protein
MPKGLQCQKRPADVIGNAVYVMRIATGQIEDAKPEPALEAQDAAAPPPARFGVGRNQPLFSNQATQ